jgi:uncharacterized membrane protein
MRFRIQLVLLSLGIVFLSIFLPIAARLYTRHLKRKDRRAARKD